MSAPVKGNKAELAARLGVSLPTLAQWMVRYGDDFPTEQRGSKGVSYVYDFASVFAFLRAKREEQEQAAAEKDELLAQLVLPFDVPGETTAPASLTLQDQSRVLDIRRKQREERIEAGQLVEAELIAAGVGQIIARFSRDSQGFIRQIAREQAWPDSYARAVSERYADIVRTAVAALQEKFEAGSVAEAMRDAG